MGGSGAALAASIIYILCVAAWVFGIMGPFFFVLKRVGWFRVPPEVEAAGLDVSHHGGSACELLTWGYYFALLWHATLLLAPLQERCTRICGFSREVDL